MISPFNQLISSIYFKSLHINFLVTLSVCNILLISVFNISIAGNVFSKPEQPYIDRLENGMEIVLVPNHSVKMIAANFVIKVGSRDEDWETWGAAHFLEHLLFNGTINRSQEEIYAQFDRLGAYHNAHTGSHFTDFMLLSATTNFLPALSIMAEMIFSSTLPRWKFEKERGIVMEEIARSRPDIYRTSQKFSELLHKNSSLSRNVLGSVNSIERLERKRVLEFYKGWYNPNNILLFVTGDFDPDTMLTKVSDLMKLYPPHDLPERKQFDLPEFSTYADQTFVRVSEKIKKNSIIIGQEAPKPEHPDFASLLFLRDLLEKRMESFFPAGVSGSTDLNIDHDMCILRTEITFPDTLTSEVVVNKFDSILSSLADKSIKQSEIDQIARNFRADEIFTSEKLHYYGVMNSSYWALVPYEEFKTWPDRMGEFTPKYLRHKIAEWLQTNDRLIMAFIPDKKAVNNEASSNSVILSGVQRYDSTGYPLLLTRTDRSARVFALHILFRDRWKWDAKYGTGSVDILHRLMKNGTDKHGVSVSDRLERISGSLKTFDSAYIPYDDYYTSPEYSFLRFETLPEHWEEGINLIFDLLDQTPIEGSMLVEAKSSMVSGYENSRRNATKVGRKLLRSSIIPEHALAKSVYGSDSQIGTEELENLKSDFFSFDNMIISISSPIGSSELVNAVHRKFNEKHIKSSESNELSDGLTNMVAPAVTSGAKDSVSLGKSQGAVVMGKVIQSINTDEKLPLIIANSFLNERLAMVLREQQGLAYSLGSRIIFRPGKGDSIWALWEISVGTRAENLTKVETGIADIINEFQNSHIKTETIERLCSSIAGRQMMRSMARIGQAFSMGTNEYYWKNASFGSDISKELESVNELNVNAVAKKYLQPNNFHIIIVD